MQLLAAALSWHLAVMPIWITPPKSAPIERDAKMNALLKPYDSGLTFSTEAECQAHVSTATADGQQNVRAILVARGLPAYFTANFACTRE